MSTLSAASMTQGQCGTQKPRPALFLAKTEHSSGHLLRVTLGLRESSKPAEGCRHLKTMGASLLAHALQILPRNWSSMALSFSTGMGAHPCNQKPDPNLAHLLKLVSHTTPFHLRHGFQVRSINIGIPVRYFLIINDKKNHLKAHFQKK